MKIIVAINNSHCIGNNNSLIIENKEDLKLFTQATMDNVVIMGRKTFESLEKPLQGRVNIVVSSTMSQCGLNGVSVCRDIMEAIVLATEKFPEKEIFFIGGGKIYKQTIDIVSEIHLSVFEDECCEECDTYFPQINYDEFDIISRKKFVGFKQFILKRK